MSYTFSTSAVRPSERFDYFYEAVARSYVRCGMSVLDEKSFNVDFELKPVDCLNVSMVQSNAVNVSAHKSCAHDVTFLMIGLEGQSRIVQNDREMEIGPGQMVLLDTARPYIIDISDRLNHIVIEMPRSELAARIGPIETALCRSHSTRSPEGMLAANYVRHLFANTQDDLSESGSALARQALDVVALALSGGSSETVRRLSSPAAVSRLRLHHAVEDCLSTRGSCEDVAGMAGISARYANMLLTQEGTSLERLMMQRRLEKCRDSLRDPVLANEAIGQIAQRWGFQSPSHFARAFKETYGITARDYRYARGDAVLTQSAAPDRRRVASGR